MDKGSNQKGKSSVSPTLLTPCRPVGLRRKRSTVKTPSSSSVNLSNLSSSPSTPVNTSSLKTCVLATRTAPANNLQEVATEPGVKSDWKNVDTEDQRNPKRKSLTPCRNSILKRKIGAFSTSSSPASPSIAEKQVAITKTEETEIVLADVSQDCDDLKSSEMSHPTNVLDKSIAMKEITAVDINALKNQIASKEKRLKEQELAALYKKKHDPKQVAKEIDNWLRGCKEALDDLQSELAKRGQSYSITQLLKTLGIPPSLVDVEEDDSE